jgi:hypothetical protein
MISSGLIWGDSFTGFQSSKERLTFEGVNILRLLQPQYLLKWPDFAQEIRVGQVVCFFLTRSKL